ncbi:MAG: GreA/GreB family elongation factor [bacterium]|nr:GreA/GreB family elongation factor [bacterium]
MQIPRRKSEALKKRDEGPVYLTENGLRQLQERLARLKKALPNFIVETQRTAAYGDRSDNAEYGEAKSTLRRTHGQILSLEDRIKRAVVIRPSKNFSSKVRLSSTVVLEVDGVRKIFQILGPHESDPARGRISYKSPLGAALLDHRKDETVIIKTATGLKKYRILEIR